MIILKTHDELDAMDRANRVVHDVLDLLVGELRQGVALGDLDAKAEAWTKERGAEPAFKGYRNYPACVCISVNDEVVHGIPGKRRLEQGDLVSLDFGVRLGGYYGDAARTAIVGTTDAGGDRLIQVTRAALLKGVEKARAGGRLSDISHAVQQHVEAQGYSVVRDFVGHGIGRELHEEPQVPNFGAPGMGPKLQAGMVLAIEPMVNEGGYEVVVDGDGWTVRTKDGSRSAHFEYSVAVTPSGPWVLGVERP
jgi:methionyl aminopeptidase